jgi:alpha-L-fucosidase
MQANGESIYGTTASPFRKLIWGRCTQKPGKLYLHVFNWPKDGQLVVPIANPVTKAYLLADPGKGLAVIATERGASIEVPAAAPDPSATVVVAEIQGAPQPLANNLTQEADGTIRLAAAEADILGENAKLEGAEEMNIGFWTNVNDMAQWQVRVDKPGSFEVEVSLACDKGSGGSQYVVVVGDQAVVGKVEETGSWTSYEVVKLGTVRLAKPGMVTVVVRAVSKPNLAVMNLRSVVLRPVAD